MARPANWRYGGILLLVGLAPASGTVFTAPASARAAQQLSSSVLGGTGAGLVMGRVVDGATGAPIAGARVASSLGPPWVVTDSQGRFVYFDLPAGTYVFAATKPGYIGGYFGQRWAGSTSPVLAPGMKTDTQQQFVTLGAGETRSDVMLRLWKDGAISGRVVDEAGEPVVGLVVQAWAVVFQAGRSVLNSALPVIAGTDDRGVYRISEVPPGRYVVAVPQLLVTTPANVPELPRSTSPWLGADFVGIEVLNGVLGVPAAGSSAAMRSGDWLSWLSGSIGPTSRGSSVHELGYRTTFHAGVTAASDASRLDVRPGEEVGGIDFQLMPVPVHSVSGHVSGPTGPAAYITVRLADGAPGSTDIPTARTATAVTDARGAFMFRGVPTGEYRLQVIETPRTGAAGGIGAVTASDLAGLYDFSADFSLEAQTLWASVPVAVATDISDLEITLQTGVRLTGRLAFEGKTPPPSASFLTKVSVLIDRADGSLPTMRADREVDVGPSGDFHSVGLPPGRYFVRVPAPPPGWALQSVDWEGRDLSVEPLEVRDASVSSIVVRFTDRPSEVNGSVRTKEGSPDVNAAVVVFPVDARRWTDYGWQPRDLTFARVDLTGRYAIRGLSDGDYCLVAVDDAVLVDWGSPHLFEALSRLGEPLHVSDGAVKTVDLVMREVR